MGDKEILRSRRTAPILPVHAGRSQEGRWGIRNNPEKG
ncbi:hypothetical protein TPChic_0466a [Treponema pallidum subsp. pallidum str. Chicago]|nr:hypothetical protein TPChic_0466a [Treponema pallidum subsp. pallidum str. Chicago]